MMFTLIQNGPVQPRPFTARMATWWRQFASLPEPDELDYPFARSDVAKLQQFTGEPSQIDEQTWDEMLLDSYTAQLTQEASIFGQQRLHQRLASGVADVASRERVDALLAAPAQQQQLEQAMRPLRAADMEVSTPLFGTPLPAPAWWSRWLTLPVLLLFVTLLVACLFAPLAWIAVIHASGANRQATSKVTNSSSTGSVSQRDHQAGAGNGVPNKGVLTSISAARSGRMACSSCCCCAGAASKASTRSRDATSATPLARRWCKRCWPKMLASCVSCAV